MSKLNSLYYALILKFFNILIFENHEFMVATWSLAALLEQFLHSIDSNKGIIINIFFKIKDTKKQQ